MPATVTAGGTLTYTLTATNNGASDAQNVTVSDDLPAGTTLVSETHDPSFFTLNTPPLGINGNVSLTPPLCRPAFGHLHHYREGRSAYARAIAIDGFPFNAIGANHSLGTVGGGFLTQQIQALAASAVLTYTCPSPEPRGMC